MAADGRGAEPRREPRVPTAMTRESRGSRGQDRVSDHGDGDDNDHDSGAAPVPDDAREATPDLAVGVGPHPLPWPDDPRLDPALLADGDRRNVLDRYRYWSLEAIVADLDLRRHPFVVAIENWQHDLNIGTVVRTANAFLAAEVIIVGRRRWNRRGAMVTDRYQHIGYVPDAAGLRALADDRGLALIAIDNHPGAVPLVSGAAAGLHPAVRAGGPGPDRRGAGRRRRRLFDSAIWFDAVDQRRGGRRDRDARLDPGARRAARPVLNPPVPS
jgi:hypothetical protein